MMMVVLHSISAIMQALWHSRCLSSGHHNSCGTIDCATRVLRKHQVQCALMRCVLCVVIRVHGMITSETAARGGVQWLGFLHGLKTNGDSV